MDLKEAQLTDFKVTARHPWELARLRAVEKLLETYLSPLTKNPVKVLDIGCGDTWVIEQLTETLTSARFHAVDIAFTEEVLSHINSKYASSRKPIRAFRSMSESLEADTGQVDLILLLDVIEHIEDDISFLKTLHEHPGVNENTRILITVPAYQSLFCSHDVFLEHYRRYNNAMLSEHVIAGGMEPIHVGYFFTSLLLFRGVQVMKEKIFSADEAKGIGDWQGSKFKTDLMTGILNTDYNIGAALRKMGISLPGLSNFIICKPSA